MKSMKAFLIGAVVIASLALSGAANATPSLLPQAQWCPVDQPFYMDVTQVAIYTTTAYDNTYANTCQIITIGYHQNYIINDLSAYGWNGSDHVQSIAQGGHVQGVFYSGTSRTGTYNSLGFGGQVWSTSAVYGYYPASLQFWRN